MKIGVWHGEKHDDATVTEVEVSDLHRWVTETRNAGGFYTGSHAEKNFQFVPWHRINWIEQQAEEPVAEDSGLGTQD